jgi:transmembrane sensor
LNKEHEHHALASACEWYAILNDESVSEKDKNDWHRWLNQSPKHGQAWQRVEQAGRHLSGLDPTLARAALNAPKGMGRRAALKKLSVGLLGLFGAGYLAQSHFAKQLSFQVLALSAEYQTKIGERRHIEMATTDQIWVNTGSSLDIDPNGHSHTLYLRNGEIFVKRDHPFQQPPLLIDSAHGRMTARGTRFTVRSQFQDTLLTVFDGTVEIETLDGQKQQIQQGQQARFNAKTIGPRQAAEKFRATWVNGILLVDNWRLDEFIQELGRYYDGEINLDPTLSKRRLVGSFSIEDIPQTLRAIQNTLNVRVYQRHEQNWFIGSA